MAKVGVSAFLFAVAVLAASAQQRIPAAPPADGPAFDVVSIKRNVSEVVTSRSVGERPGGVFMLSAMAIAPVIRTAYPADTSDLIGAPDWVSSEIYDLTARANRDVPREEMQAMLQRMLAERFKLAVHYEMQERPVYSLVIARPDGRRLTVTGAVFRSKRPMAINTSEASSRNTGQEARSAVAPH